MGDAGGGGGGSHHHLHRTISDSKMAGGDKAGKRSPQHKNSVTKAWLQFQADIEAALFRKPSNNGMYKNLSDMLHNRMDQLEQVGRSKFEGSMPMCVFYLD